MAKFVTCMSFYLKKSKQKHNNNQTCMYQILKNAWFSSVFSLDIGAVIVVFGETHKRREKEKCLARCAKEMIKVIQNF